MPTNPMNPDDLTVTEAHPTQSAEEYEALGKDALLAVQPAEGGLTGSVP